VVWRRLSTRGDAGLDVHAAGGCALHTHSLESSPADSIAPNPASAFQYTWRQNPIRSGFQWALLSGANRGRRRSCADRFPVIRVRDRAKVRVRVRVRVRVGVKVRVG